MFEDESELERADQLGKEQFGNDGQPAFSERRMAKVEGVPRKEASKRSFEKRA